MHTAARKLHSQRGASLLFALLVFLLCLLAGVAALTAAAANVGRYTHLEGEQQQYFSAASALALLQSKLDETATADTTKVTVTYTETLDWWYVETLDKTPAGDPIYELKTNTTYKLEATPDPTVYTPKFYQYLLLKNCVPAEWWKNAGKEDTPTDSWNTPTRADYKYTVKPEDNFAEKLPGADGTLYPVNVTVREVDGSYALEMDLTTGDGDAYPLHVVWAGEAVTDTDTTTETTGDPEDPLHDSKGTRITKTTLTCTLRWSAENRTVTFGK